MRPMKVLFIEEYLPQEMLGIMWLSRAIKDAGHQSKCLFIPDKAWIDKLKEYDPDVVCYSMTTGMHLYLADVNRKVKAVLPNVATLEEQGIKGAEAIVWFGMAAPAKTPRALIGKLNRGVNEALAAPDVRKRLDQLGLEIEGGTVEKFDAFIKSEARRLSHLIKVGAVKAE